MPSEIVKRWFGSQFSNLHPLLQKLHTEGGKLCGDVEVSYGKGVAGFIGTRLAKKMNLPDAGVRHLVINISHDQNGFYWARSFDNHLQVISIFRPIGHIEQGCWVETTGLLQMELTVDINKGGWFWRCLKIKFMGLSMPRWIFPRIKAYKVIENGKYRFHVEFSLPFIGSLVSYQGLLRDE